MARKLSVLTFVLALALMALAPGATARAALGSLTVNGAAAVTICPPDPATTFMGSGLAGQTRYTLVVERTDASGGFTRSVTTDLGGVFTVTVATTGAPVPSHWTAVTNNVPIEGAATPATNAVSITFDCTTPPVFPSCPPNAPAPQIGCIVYQGTPAPTASPVPTAVPSKSPPTNNSLPPTAAPTVAAATAAPRIATLPSTSTGDNSVLLILVAMSLAGLTAGTYRFIRR